MNTVSRRQKAAGSRVWVDCGCALALAIFVASSALATGEPDLTVSVRVYNYAKVSGGVLGGAEREASRIFTAAGVDTVWVDCPTSQIQVRSTSYQLQEVEAPCPQPVSGADVDLRILPHLAPARHAFSDDMFGFADGSSLATVFYGRVEDLAHGYDGDETEIPVILGHVIAHEIGHLLLGSNSHSPAGIMCGKWDREYLRLGRMGLHVFSPEQSALMRATVFRRHAEIAQP
jgi:hypothetical protein